MKSVLLIGLGRLGKNIALNLSRMQHEVMAVDISEARVEDVLPYVTGAQIGDSTNADFLESLGVRNFDVCIVAMGSDFRSSLETAYLLRELGAKRVISRAAEDVQEKFLLCNGADEVIFPEKEIAEQAAVKYTFDNMQGYIKLDETTSIFELEVPLNWQGYKPKQVEAARKNSISIIGIRKKKSGKWSFQPDISMEEGDSILVAGQEKNVQKSLHI